MLVFQASNWRMAGSWRLWSTHSQSLDFVHFDTKLDIDFRRVTPPVSQSTSLQGRIEFTIRKRAHIIQTKSRLSNWIGKNWKDFDLFSWHLVLLGQMIIYCNTEYKTRQDKCRMILVRREDLPGPHPLFPGWPSSRAWQFQMVLDFPKPKFWPAPIWMFQFELLVAELVRLLQEILSKGPIKDTVDNLKPLVINVQRCPPFWYKSILFFWRTV